MLDEAKNAAEFNDYLRNVVYKFYTQTNLPVPKPEFIIEAFWIKVECVFPLVHMVPIVRNPHAAV